ncbi:MAG: ABC transporter [Nitrospirae bacterium GWC2_57_13]|jgi:ABC-2 type transport system ATP-binding protein|nr:MAG: ABC transporter [Nitrospirae bacterium GWC2_57_13]OGW42435.1 MAG: ABC transporter [Nitrospirae bacterium GWD2_57_8]HAS53028.1 ABC transporter [Nitrospiraceae bacterium]
MIKLTNLTKVYGKLTAVNSINLEVSSGEVFGFLGPNGAGKTTTIRMMAGLLQPTDGKVFIGGFDVQAEPLKAKAITGFIPDRPYLYDKLTATEFMHFTARLYDLKAPKERIAGLLDLFGLNDWAAELVENFSHGMKQRLVMASALLHEPKVLVVDEPMVGLDPRGARLVKDIFKDLASKGVTVFMSTHTLEIVEQMCSRVAIINQGRIIADGSVDDLARMARMPDSHLEPIFLKLTGGDEADGTLRRERS